jgi:hypothetical protein
MGYYPVDLNPSPTIRPSPAMDLDPDFLDGEELYLSYDPETWPYQPSQRGMRPIVRAGPWGDDKETVPHTQE